PDALLQLLGLGKGSEVEIGRQLFRCRNHRELPNPPAPRSHIGDQAAFSPSSRFGARILTEPPAFSTASTADFDAPNTSKFTLALSSPLPRRRTPSLARRIRPALTSAAASTAAEASSSLASIAVCTLPRFTSFSFSANLVLRKPRLGSRRWSGIWPPSKPLIRTPERAVWPLPPRPPVLPAPEPMRRPMLQRF